VWNKRHRIQFSQNALLVAHGKPNGQMQGNMSVDSTDCVDGLAAVPSDNAMRV
jgi:hypothetical protein